MGKRIIATVTNDLSGDQRMYRICSTLSEEGFDVLLVGRKRSFSKELKEFPFSTKRFNIWTESGKLFYLFYNIRLCFFLLFNRSYIRIAVDTDTLLAHSFASLFKGDYLVYDAHELFTEVPEVTNRRLSKWIWRLLEKLTIPRIKHAYTVNDSLAKIFEERYKTKFSVIRNLPVLADVPEVKYERKKNHILYQGDINEGRGLKELIDAIEDLDVHLDIAGRGPILSEIEKYVSSKDMDKKVTFHGFLGKEDLVALTNQATIGVNLLENKGLSYYYSLANKFNDYIASELPQVSMAFPEYTNINKEYGVALLVHNLEKQSLQYAINRLLTDRELYDRLQANCKKAKLELNWENEKGRLIDFYKNLK